MTTAASETSATGAAGSRGIGARIGVMPRALVLLTGAAAAVVVLAGVRAAAWLIGPAFMALIIVIAVSPVHGWLRRRGWPGWVATLAVLLLVYSIMISLALGIVLSLTRLTAELPQYAASAQSLVAGATQWLAAHGVGPQQLADAANALDLGALAGAFGAVLGSIAGLATNMVFVIGVIPPALLGLLTGAPS